MKTKLKLLTIISLALFVTGGAWVYAEVTNEKIRACVNKMGNVRILTDSGFFKKCLPREESISWNVTGPQGPQGPAGSPTWDEERIAELEARVAALEGTTPEDPPEEPGDHEDGLYAEIVLTDAERIVTDQSEYGEFTIKFDLTAYGDDYFVSATSTDALMFRVTNDTGSNVEGSIVSARTSTADIEGNSYRVNEGETETFTLNIAVVPNETGFVRAVLDTVQYGETSELPFGHTHNVEPAEDFRTDYIAIVL